MIDTCSMRVSALIAAMRTGSSPFFINFTMAGAPAVVDDLDEMGLLGAIATLQDGKDLAGFALDGSPQFVTGCSLAPAGDDKAMADELEAREGDVDDAELGEHPAAARVDAFVVDALSSGAATLLVAELRAVGSLAGPVLAACQELIVPGAIRSLADRPVKVPLAIYHNNRLLNDPQKPYWGRYLGDEDTRRKPAYHNGTAWTWLFPSFCEAWAITYGKESIETALSWLTSSTRLIESGCLGHIPEIMDGDAPHQSRGCDAQAWSVSEVYRVWHILS